MKYSLIPLLRCLKCDSTFSLTEAQAREGEVESGLLSCSGCRASYPIVRFIPRFVPSDNYADSFGFQWSRFRQTQLDSYSGIKVSRDRFLHQTAWAPESLAGAAVLDVGCGAGRFTEIALSLGAKVFAIDYSAAVDACWQNFGPHPNLQILQADIYSLPFHPASFDYVYCFGVLQHTPDPHKALLALPAQVKPGGRLAVDFYMRCWSSFFEPRYWLRPITTRVPHPTLFQAVLRSVPVLLPVSRAIGRVPVVGRMLRRLVPVANYEGIQPLNRRQLHEWAVLDTFDWLSPAYDQPQTPDVLQSWLEEADLEEIEVLKVIHLVGRGRKPGLAEVARNASGD